MFNTQPGCPATSEYLEAGRPGAALITVLKGTGDRTSVIRFVPSALLALPLDLVIRHTADRAAPDGAVSPRELISTVRNDAHTVIQAEGRLERFSTLTCEVLLMGGTRSNRLLTTTLDGLSHVLPNARRVVLPRVGHTAADNGGNRCSSLDHSLPSSCRGSLRGELPGCARRPNHLRESSVRVSIVRGSWDP